MSILHKTEPASVWLASDFESFKQQESILVILNLFVLATLLLVHTAFSSHWGEPSPWLIAILSSAFVAQAGELIWLQGRRRPLRPGGILLLTGFSISLNFSLALALELLSKREDIQYFIVMVVPILEAAFRLPFLSMLAVVFIADGVDFFWVWNYARHHSPAPARDYFEAGTVSLIFTIVGIVVSLLVNHLHQKEQRLSESLNELNQTKVRLLTEEKLAAVGRLSSAIAHEIRNPVAVIASALSTASRGNLEASEREEMFGIAAKEAQRLEKMTTDFLAYARPRFPEPASTSVDDTLGYVVDVCRPRASAKQLAMIAESSGGLTANIDGGQVQQALINLVMNAVEASPPGGRVVLRAVAKGKGSIQIDISGTADPVPAAAVGRLFEPFFTTKPTGTGLGLAIALNIARAHQGDLVLSANEPGRVCFSLILPAAPAEAPALPRKGPREES